MTTEPDSLFIDGLNDGEVRKVLHVKDRSSTETSMVEGCEEELSNGNNSNEIITEERTVVLDESDDTHQLAQAAEQMRKEQLPDGSETTLHANYLRQSNPRVSAVGIIM